MTTENQTAPELDKGNPDGVQSSESSEIPTWFKTFEGKFQDFADKVDGKFKQTGQDLGRLRAKVKGEGETPAPADKAEPAPVLTAKDVTSLVDDTMEVGQIIGSLGEGPREALKGAIEGLDPELAVKLARAFSASAIDGGQENTGQARSPKPPNPKPSHPRTVSEFMDVRQKAAGGDKTAQARVAAMDADPEFDPTTLPRRI